MRDRDYQNQGAIPKDPKYAVGNSWPRKSESEDNRKSWDSKGNYNSRDNAWNLGNLGNDEVRGAEGFTPQLPEKLNGGLN